MPPKKKETEDSEEKELDAIADAANSVWNDSEDPPSNERSKVKKENSTKAGKNDRAEEAETQNNQTVENTKNSGKERLPGPYVPEELSFALQEIQLKLRRMTGEKVSQSLIIECALEISLQDFKSRGSESGLAKLVRRKYHEDR